MSYRGPRFADAILGALIPRSHRDHLLGDLAEEFHLHVLAERGRLRAHVWYWAQLARSIGPTTFRRNHHRRGGASPRTSLPRWLFELRQDAIHGARGLARSKTFTAVAVLSLALGIGVNTGMFTFVNATLKPVPGVNGADRVVEILGTRNAREMEVWAYPDFEDVSQISIPLEIAGWKTRSGNLTTPEGARRVRVMYTTSNYFRVLGVTPAPGRAFLPSEDVGPGQNTVAIVSHSMWQNRLDGASDILGSSISLNGTPYTVVGVAPEAFNGHRPLQGATDLWVPLTQDRWVAGPNSMTDDRESCWLRVLGRLRANATVDDANAALATVFARLEQEYPASNEGRAARALPFGPIPAMGRAESMLGVYALFVLLGVVLLIICGNVTGMVLARSATREREISVRMALGSGRGRLARLLIVEALLLALTGGALGVAFAYWGSLALMTIAPPLPDGSFLDVRPNGVILLYTLVLTIGATLAVGLIPAIRFSRPDLVSSLKDDTGGGGRRVSRIHRLAVTAQTGVALVLLVSATLNLRAMGAMVRRELGFEPRNLLVARIDLSQTGDESPEAASAILDRLGESLGSVPGIESWSVSDGIPLDLVGNFTRVIRPDSPDEASGRATVEFTLATEGFFETVGTPVLRGRGFEATDNANSEPVVVITRALGDRMWPGEDPVGKQLRFSERFRFSLRVEDDRDFTVIGVVDNVASSRATEDWPQVFVPLRQNFGPRLLVAIRAVGDAPAAARPLQSAILATIPDLPIPTVTSSERLVERSTDGQRIMAQMAAGFGFLALLLSAIGVYGVVAYAVANRTREIGVRLALGATQSNVLRTVLGDAIRLAAPGLVVGGMLAAAVGFAMRSSLLGVSPFDPIAFGSVVGVLLAVVLLASVLPARKASSTDPLTALRCE